MPRNNRKAAIKVPRKPRAVVTDRQERFALEYVKDFDRVRAYHAAGYTSQDDATVASEACRLLKNPNVYAIILREKAKIADRMGWSAERTILYLQTVFMEAMEERDFGSAVAALDKIAKFYGLYEKHQVQKKYTQEDVEKLKAELKAVGFSFERVNFPGSN